MKPTIIIAGAGGIAQALGLILSEWSPHPLRIRIGNRTLEKATRVVEWIREGSSSSTELEAFFLPEHENYPKEAEEVLIQGDILLDCLPGKEAPRMARLARKFDMHYANLTEHVRETEEIIRIGEGSQKAFILQCGIAPGFIDILANGMFNDFCRKHRVEKVDEIAMRVGGLSENAAAPSYYAFTWSPAGVATEYIEPALAVRNFEKLSLPSLTERRRLLVRNIAYEEALTSGGAADLPDALAGKVKNLDYKTLRYPGHYEWIEHQLKQLTNSPNKIQDLQRKMEEEIPHEEKDVVVVYCAVQGKDSQDVLRREETSYLVRPQKVGKHLLRAIQTTTAAPIAEIALEALKGKYHGVVLQSMIDPKTHLKGAIIEKVFK
jgi:saccharopine dehydrogenase-like NADP-dependent oxidoreductase